MLEDSQPLHDERTQQFNFFFFSDWSMNAGRKDYRHLRRRNTRLHETPHQKIYDLRTRSGTSCIGNDDQYRIIAAYDFINGGEAIGASNAAPTSKSLNGDSCSLRVLQQKIAPYQN